VSTTSKVPKGDPSHPKCTTPGCHRHVAPKTNGRPRLAGLEGSCQACRDRAKALAWRDRRFRAASIAVNDNAEAQGVAAC